MAKVKYGDDWWDFSDDFQNCANDLLAGGAQISFVEVEYIQWLDHFVVHFDVFFQY